MDNDFYVIVLAFAANLFLLILSEVLGMSKGIKPNSVTELATSSASALAKVIIEKLKPAETSQN